MAKNPRGKEHKVILLGASGVGKGNLFGTFCQNHSVPSSSTGFADKKTRSFVASTENDESSTVRSTHMELELWHPAGLERFGSLTLNYGRDTDIAILCYSQHDENSARELQRYVDYLDRLSSSPMVYLCALETGYSTGGSTAVTEEVQLQLDKLEHMLQLKECLIKEKFTINPHSRTEVDNLMTSLASQLHDKHLWHSRSRSMPPSPDGVNLHVSASTPAKTQCCLT